VDLQAVARRAVIRWLRVLRWFGLYPDTFLPAPTRVIEMSPLIAALDPDTSQFTAMMERLPWRVSPVAVFTWNEDESFPRVLDTWGPWTWVECPQ
jgi:hypothetical protein